MLLRLIIASACAVSVAGCEATIRGKPSVQYDTTRPHFTDIVLQHRLSETALIAALDSDRAIDRNRVIFARIAEIDALYNAYETTVLAEARQSGFLLSLASLGAGLAGGFATGQTSQIYSLIGGGIGAIQTSYDKEVLAEQTMQAFISQMRAGRAKVRSQILTNLLNTPVQYPIEAALIDLERYRQAGTLATAIVGINDNASDAERIAEIQAAQTTRDVLPQIEVTIVPDTPLAAEDVTEDTVTATVVTGEAIRDEGVVSDAELAAFLNAPNTGTEGLDNDLEELREAVVLNTGNDPLSATDISPTIRGLIANAVLRFPDAAGGLVDRIRAGDG